MGTIDGALKDYIALGPVPALNSPACIDYVILYPALAQGVKALRIYHRMRVEVQVPFAYTLQMTLIII